MTAWLASLRVRFVLLVLLAVVPALGLLLYTASEQREVAVAEAQDEASRLARLAAADQGRLIEGTRQLLTVLQRLPEVRGGDPAACSALLADLLADFPLYANLGVIEPDGNLSCSAVPPPGPTNLGDRAYFRRAVETRAFTVGEYQVGRVTGKATLNCGYPVLDGAGQVRGVVYAALDLDWVNRFASEARLPPDAVLTVLDRGGTVLVRYPDPEAWLGQSLAATPVVQTILSQGTGVTEAPDEDGSTQLYAYTPLGGAAATEAYLSIAIPKAGVVAPAERVFSDSVTRLGLIAALVLVAAWVGGDLLVQRDIEAHKALVRRVYDAFRTGGVDLLDEVVAPDVVDHDPVPGQAPGLAGLKQAVGLFRAAFPDGQLSVEELTAEGDRVVARVTLRGTHTGEFFGTPPTGQSVTAEGVETFRIRGGKVVEAWSRFGPLAPAPGAATPRREAEPARPSASGGDDHVATGGPPRASGTSPG